MTDSREPDGSTRITGSTGHTPTTSGGDVTGRMAGTGPATRADGSYAPTTVQEPVRREERTALRHKTSAAAVFALVFGLAALFCALTAILSPAAVVLGIIGLVLGIVGLKTSKRPGVTGHGVAVGGLVTAVLGLLLGGAVIGGLAAVVNSNSQLDRISHKIDQLKNDLPSGSQVTNSVK